MQVIYKRFARPVDTEDVSFCKDESLDDSNLNNSMLKDRLATSNTMYRRTLSAPPLKFKVS
jgi:hypothetical protein